MDLVGLVVARQGVHAGIDAEADRHLALALPALHGRQRLAGRRIVWFLDNSSALYSYVKGVSGNAFPGTPCAFHLTSMLCLQGF